MVPPQVPQRNCGTSLPLATVCRLAISRLSKYFSARSLDRCTSLSQHSSSRTNSLPRAATDRRNTAHCTQTDPESRSGYGCGGRLTRLISDKIENEFSFFTFLSFFSASNREKKEKEYRIREKGWIGCKKYKISCHPVLR